MSRINAMFSPSRRLLLGSAASLGAASACPFAMAQTSSAWPQRPVKWIVSQPGGAGPDIGSLYC
jgi:hypothetical protein